MCNRGKDCEGYSQVTVTNEKFIDCCLGSVDSSRAALGSSVTVFDSDKEEYIGCRCPASPVPISDPTDYIVPPTSHYRSTGV